MFQCAHRNEDPVRIELLVRLLIGRGSYHKNHQQKGTCVLKSKENYINCLFMRKVTGFYNKIFHKTLKCCTIELLLGCRNYLCGYMKIMNTHVTSPDP